MRKSIKSHILFDTICTLSGYPATSVFQRNPSERVYQQPGLLLPVMWV